MTNTNLEIVQFKVKVLLEMIVIERKHCLEIDSHIKSVFVAKVFCMNSIMASLFLFLSCSLRFVSIKHSLLSKLIC